jgi:hypothetical protein
LVSASWINDFSRLTCFSGNSDMYSRNLLSVFASITSIIYPTQ